MSMPSIVMERIEDVVRETKRGAWWCFTHILEGLSIACREGIAIDRDHVADAIERANPSMAMLRNLAYIVRKAEDLCSAVQKLEVLAREAREQLIEKAGEFVKGRIVTISYSSAVASAIARYRDRVEMVWVLESRPGAEGIDLYGYLSSLGVEARLIPDSMAWRAIEDSDIVVVGADAIDGDGCIVNKIGSKILAILARERGIPFVVLCESLKIYPYASCRDLARAVKRRFSIDDIELELPIFEAVEPRYVSYIVTDRGLALPDRNIVLDIYGDLMELLGIEIG